MVGEHSGHAGGERRAPQSRNASTRQASPARPEAAPDGPKSLLFDISAEWGEAAARAASAGDAEAARRRAELAAGLYRIALRRSSQ